MKQYLRIPMPTLLILTLTSTLLAACGGGNSSSGNAKPMLEQLPTMGATAGSAQDAATSASSPEAAASANLTAQATDASASAATAASGPTAQPSTATAAASTAATSAAVKTQQGAGTTTAGTGTPGATTSTAALPSVAIPSGATVAATAPPAGEVAEAPNAKITAGAESATTAATASNCVINETRYYGGSCWATIKASVPTGTNRSFPNSRLNYTGSVNANCIAGKVNWSTGTCKSTAAASVQQAAGAAATARPSSSAYKIGTFYFPGWKDNQAGAPAKFPWTSIKSYPEREPMLGWYDDGSVAVVEQQLKWMRTYGIDYVVFDWFWNGKGTELNHTVNAYLKTETKKDVPFALLWSNHLSVPRTKLEFTSMVDYWISQYFNKPEFMKIDGKPVIFVFSHLSFVKQAAQFGETVPSLLAQAEARAKAAGYKGIYFVGGTHVDSALLKTAATSGYSALSAYNYHGRADDMSVSFQELDSAYQHVWNWILKESSIPYILPMSQGWDKRPWGGSTNPLHDMSGGVLPDFEAHLAEARRLMDANPGKTMKTGVICCWNEFGEGSFIEPTKKDGFRYLEKVQKVFGSP